MIRAILSDAAELAGLALFLAALAMVAMPADAMAGDASLAAPRACLPWIAGAMLGGALVGGMALAIALMRRAVSIGDDAAEHENNMTAAMRAESIKGGEQ